MKSSPKSNEMPLSTGSKTPASSKKLVQARLPFKTLSGSEPPFSVTNDTSSETSSLADADNRKRKQSDDDDGISAAKLNRCEYKKGDNISLETNEIMELSNDIPMQIESENDTSESKENVCVAKHTVDEIELIDDHSEMDLESAQQPKAKQSLDFERKPTESRKSKRSHEPNLIMIKLPMSKKSKDAARKEKKHRKKSTGTQNKSEMHNEKGKEEEEEADTADEATATEEEEEVTQPDNDKETDAKPSSTMTEQQAVEHMKSDSGDDEGSANNNSVVSNPSEQCSTPSNHKLTPKQMQKRLESEKKKQEKEQARIERERKLQEEKEMRQREKDEKEQQKKREREEKEEQRKREKEMREKKLLEEKQEKQREKEREKEMKEQQRKIEREEKEEQRKREREEKELQKKREREEKEREKEEERKKKEDEKRQKLEAEQNKNRKTAEAFAKFFVAKKVESKSDLNEIGEQLDSIQMPQTFMSFQVKDDMKIAPATRRTLNYDERLSFEKLLSSGIGPDDLYLKQLRNNKFAPRKSSRTWADDDDEKSSNDDLFVIEENGQNVQLVEVEPKKLYRAKFFKFEDNRRPPYYGTWRKKSKTIHGRKPLALDTQLDYDVDSDEEWEEEEPGESLSDDEKEVESDDEYEIDNEFFVPHGHLSDEELQDEDEPEFNNPADLKIKLKMAQNEFDDERKKKTQKLKPRLIGFIWQKMDGSKPDNCSNGVWDLMNRSAMLFNGPTVKVERPSNHSADNSDDENVNLNKSLGVRRLPIAEKEIPDLIRLINGNQNNSKFLVKEFCAYLAKNNPTQREYSQVSIKAKIKELAHWQACPEEGPMFRKMCWYVSIATRKRYDLNDLSFPNTWSYTIPPRRPIEIPNTDGNSKETEQKAAETQDSIQISDDSNSCNFASETLTPELIKQAKSKKTNYNIAKFIRALTHDEKKKQFEPITFNRRSSEDQSIDTPSTSQTIDSKNKKATKRAAPSTSDSTVPKKRINLLMSGPIGKDFSPKTKNTLVTQFLSSSKKQQSTTNTTDNDTNGISSTYTAGASHDTKNTQPNDTVIVID